METNGNSFFAQAIANLAESFAKHLYTKAKEYIKDFSNESAVYFDKAYEMYLSNTIKQNAKIKTLLYRHEPKHIYSFYECIGLRLGKRIVDTSAVGNVLECGNKLIVTGTGGIGKSVMLKHFFINCVKTQDLIPVLIELRGLNNIDYKAGSLVDYIYSTLCLHNFSLEKQYFLYSLELGKYLFLMDGFDELRNNISQQVAKDITDMCSKYQDNCYIVASRPQEQFIGWTDFCELTAMPLNKTQALNLISKLEYDEVLKNKFYNDLNESLFEKHNSFASNPLLLTIMLITYENSVSIPDNLNEFYEQAFAALFHTHDASKGAYKRDIYSGLGYEDFKRIFSYFCFKSYFKSQYEFSLSELTEYIRTAQMKLELKKDFDVQAYIRDLTDSVCMLVVEGLKYRFSHRSFQEYFAALYTMQLGDENQKKLITLWLKEEQYPSDTSSYLQMLADLQRDRFNNNILLPMLTDLNELYKSKQNNIFEVFNEIYKSIRILYREGDKTYEISVRVCNPYLYNAIIWACRNFEYKFPEEDKAKYNSVSRKLLKAFSAKDKPWCEFNLKQAMEKGLYKEAVYCVHWVTERISFAIQCKAELESTRTPILKRKLATMLDEL